MKFVQKTKIVLSKSIHGLFNAISSFFYFIETLARILFKGHLILWNKIRKSDDEVLIVGNGPSLSKYDLSEVKEKGIELCCVNSFANENPSFFQLKPKYYCAIDPEIYSPKALVPEDNEKLFEALKKVDWPMIFICKIGQKLPFNNPNIKYVRLPDIAYEKKICSHFFYKHCLASYRLINVVGACLFYCITSRMKRIFLIGVENNWHRELIVASDNTVYRKKEHFYGEYLENVTKTGIIGRGELYKYFEFYASTLKSYYFASKYADYLKVEVYNLTTDSFIDTFKKCEKLW